MFGWLSIVLKISTVGVVISVNKGPFINCILKDISYLVCDGEVASNKLGRKLIEVLNKASSLLESCLPFNSRN